MAPSAKNPLIAQFIRLADVGRSKSSILNPLQWMTIVFLAAIVILQFGHPPTWLTILLAVLVVSNFGLFSVAYFYFMRQRPHALRSEAFDFKVTELLQNRGGEIKAGRYEEVSFVREVEVLSSPSSPQKNEESNNE